MKIGIYARGLSGIGGVKQYIDSMCRAMIRNLGDEDELHIIHNSTYPYFAHTSSRVSETALPTRIKAVADFVLGPRAINRLQLDVVWFTKYVIPFGVKAKRVTTVHDMAYFMPELSAYTLRDTLYMRNMIRTSLARADGVVAVSNNTKKDILRILDIQDEKVTVIPEAADKRFRKLKVKRTLDALRSRYNLPGKYILFTGGISPRKNLSRLILAFGAVSPRIEHRLVITGAKGWKSEEVNEAMAGNSRVLKLGFVEDEDMPALYNAADLFVYPSLYEGFGLPVLEAQQCGCPVLCSENSSLIEVGGEGVQFIDPSDVGGMAEAIMALLSDEERRKQLIALGYKNARRFSWDASAKRMLELFSSIAG